MENIHKNVVLSFFLSLTSKFPLFDHRPNRVLPIYEYIAVMSVTALSQSVIQFLDAVQIYIEIYLITSVNQKGKVVPVPQHHEDVWGEWMYRTTFS
jgi:hypothetical protein